MKDRFGHGREPSHGGSAWPEYFVWNTMRQRCKNKRYKCYKDYGGRGIKVCRRWRYFANFIADMGRRPSPKHQIDRIENDGHYEPGNCRWALRKVQMRNTRRNHLLTFKGETLTISDWAASVGIERQTVSARLKRGWSVARALTEPLRC
jgi:hypothetical protein